MFASSDLKIILLRPLIAKGVCLVLVVFLSWQWITYAKEFRDILHHQNNNTLPSVTISSNDSSQLEKSLNMPLFGKFISKEDRKLPIKRTTLNVNLVGVLFSPQKQNSYVIIRTADRKELVFKMGDTIPGGAIIKKITTDGVLVERDGVLESLSLPKNELIFDAPPKPLK